MANITTKEHNFRCIRGNNWNQKFRFKNTAGNQTLTNWSFQFNINASYLDATPTIQVTDTSGINVTTSSGLINVALTPTHTTQSSTNFYYELRSQDNQSEINTCYRGTFTFDHEVIVV